MYYPVVFIDMPSWTYRTSKHMSMLALLTNNITRYITHQLIYISLHQGQTLYLYNSVISSSLYSHFLTFHLVRTHGQNQPLHACHPHTHSPYHSMWMLGSYLFLYIDSVLFYICNIYVCTPIKFHCI